MKLIIDIDKKEYYKIYTMVHDNLMEFLGVPNSIDVAIANGTPFDKIRAEIENADAESFKNPDYHRGLLFALDTINKHIGGTE